MVEARDILVARMRTDLIGPSETSEIISDRPTDRYLTGILFPPRTGASPEEDDEAADADDAEFSGTSLDSVKAASTFRPSSAGLSFAVRPTVSEASLDIVIEAARYRAVDTEGSEEPRAQNRRAKLWQRMPLRAGITLNLSNPEAVGHEPISLAEKGIADASLHVRIARWAEILLVTVALTNDAKPAKTHSRQANEEAALFQVSLSVTCQEGCRFTPKPDRSGHAEADDDARASALLYRDVRQWAVGHTCSAVWDEAEDATVGKLSSSWLPETTVHLVSAAGDVEFGETESRKALDAGWLANESEEGLAAGLLAFIDAYSQWIEKNEATFDTLPKESVEQAKIHLTRCREAEQRMRRGVSLLREDAQVLAAFRMANAAMALQYSWREEPDPPKLSWRPFQLGFALLCLESIADDESPDRETMDLLWFPTGGGKTEAYLLLTAFTAFLRRLRAEGAMSGAGVTVFMRYTLRLLTIQQFERAAALISACELVRLGEEPAGSAEVPDHFRSDMPISLGLWVGEGATPNSVKAAEMALETESDNSPAQLKNCPCCHQELTWDLSSDRKRVEVSCKSASCRLADCLPTLPVWTVDEDVYRAQPTLLIGTVDKFAQLVRNQASGRLFGIGTEADPPSMVIQDELHLISGPLGSLTGLYEAAVDEMCRNKSGRRAKILGSTATIRRAEDQISALFDRRSFQFPPPGLSHRNSGFAVEDREAPGRHYVGVTTVGRSAKFAQQAVAASLLQSAGDPGISDVVRNGYWTLVNYFNSLRELGGALSLMRDDVDRTISDYCSRRPGEIEREAGTQIELTSRVRSSEIPGFLKDLERGWDDPDHIDVVLASNMISVGMDVSRLGLMLVNGQPKTIAEYIQATSRVGRSRSFPGLVVTLFNAAKSRDRSRYETFSTWHRSLYRDVEATSVTPFAPRARDRALHAPYVALVRHLIEGMEDPSKIVDHQHEAEALLERIVERIQRIDAQEAAAAREQLNSFLDDWFDRDGLKDYWLDYGDALLTSAEAAAERGNRARFAGQRPTPNSMRSVEASTAFVLLEGVRQEGNRR
ncbi:helicase C-terminal domain-containing protein [Citromicrobium bathyomarinum]|uniref:helicase C-terminal domain-containing protein n=1 Tax=Citromicrobium bathyomarinum TaxID=72174 RepID=UPI001E6157DD|nr:helicase C-terminal domain-containing protein [Citromicrobium bathyomarinum]MCD1623466.1 helicase C-terminal domain-containing protein [Citromicrobium bathyomarinum]